MEDDETCNEQDVEREEKEERKMNKPRVDYNVNIMKAPWGAKHYFIFLVKLKLPQINLSLSPIWSRSVKLNLTLISRAVLDVK